MHWIIVGLRFYDLNDLNVTGLKTFKKILQTAPLIFMLYIPVNASTLSVQDK